MKIIISVLLIAMLTGCVDSDISRPAPSKDTTREVEYYVFKPFGKGVKEELVPAKTVDENGDVRMYTCNRDIAIEKVYKNKGTTEAEQLVLIEVNKVGIDCGGFYE